MKNTKKLILTLATLFTSVNASCVVDGVRSDDTLSVRTGPSPRYSKVGELYPYTEGIFILHCIRKSGSSRWCKIKYYDSGSIIKGWVNRRYLNCSY